LSGDSDIGSAALSGSDNDWATYIGPASDYATAATLYGGATAGVYGASDAFTGDANDVAIAINSNTTQLVSAAAIIDATNSSAYADNGGWVGVENETGLGTMTDDVASATGPSAAFVYDDGGTGTVSGDGAYATNGAYAYITDYSGTGNVQDDVATASGTNSFANVGNGYNETYSAPGVDGSTEPVSYDSASAFDGGTAIVGEDQSDTIVPVTYDLASAGNGGLESLIDVLGHVAFAPYP